MPRPGTSIQAPTWPELLEIVAEQSREILTHERKEGFRVTVSWVRGAIEGTWITIEPDSEIESSCVDGLTVTRNELNSLMRGVFAGRELYLYFFSDAIIRWRRFR